jgi:hypothetical protein
MKLRYRLFRRRNGLYFLEDRVTGKPESLKTRDKGAARRIFNARNEAHEQPAINLQIARAYLMVSDPLIVQRAWLHAMDEILKTKHGPTRQRWFYAIREKAFNSIRSLCLVETQAEHLLRVLEQGTVSTNVHLRKLHNFCLDKYARRCTHSASSNVPRDKCLEASSLPQMTRAAGSFRRPLVCTSAQRDSSNSAAGPSLGYDVCVRIRRLTGIPSSC